MRAHLTSYHPSEGLGAHDTGPENDVRNELVSLRSAREDYGVVIDPATWTIDEAETLKLREQWRAARGWRQVPTVSRE